MWDKTLINQVLDNLHNLNHPYLTLFSAVSNLLIGFFVFLKNRHREVNRVFLFMTVVLSIWYVGNFISMEFFNSSKLGFFGYLLGYTGVSFISVGYYHFFIASAKGRGRKLLFIFYGIAIIEDLFLWLYPYSSVGTVVMPNVGVLWEKPDPLFFSFLLFGMIKYGIISCLTAFSFLRESRKETLPILKKQLKAYGILFFIMAGGVLEWLVIFGIHLHIIWLLVPSYASWMAFSIVRYQILDIETVVHRTLLWLLTSCLAIIPIGFLIKVFYSDFSVLSWWQITVIFTFFFYFAIFYSHRVQPRIDHLFRRKKYDAYEALNNISSRLAKEADISAITKRLFKELRDTLYIRNAVLLMELPKRNVLEEIARTGFDDLEKRGVMVSHEQIILPMQSALIPWFRKNLVVLEKDRLMLDYYVGNIKHEAMSFLDTNALEALIPIVLEGELKGLLGIGKKETLKSYTQRDMQLFEDLGRQISLVLNSALRQRDLVEKKLLNNITGGIDEGLILFDNDDRVVWVNTKALAIYNLTEDAVIGRRYNDVIPSIGDKHQLKDALGVSAPGCDVYEYRDQDGHTHYFEISVFPIKDEDGGIKYFLHISRDLTQRIKLEEELKKNYDELAKTNEKLKDTQYQLVQSGKMASLGQLAGGVAHEINNPLTGVLNNVQLVKIISQEKKEFNLNDFSELLGAIEESAIRCKKITQSLLEFSRMSKGNYRPLVFNEVVEKTIDLLLLEAKLNNITIEKDFMPDLPHIRGNPQLLQQVVFDLVINAKWAIGQKSGRQGGTIALKTTYEPDTKNVCFSISDTGIGIPAENLEKIFDPFFTTKEIGEGTGLGLSIAYSIIKEHGGTIEVKSETGKGTTFTVRIPVEEKQ